jgi:hypothetical protein
LNGSAQWAPRLIPKGIHLENSASYIITLSMARRTGGCHLPKSTHTVAQLKYFISKNVCN